MSQGLFAEQSAGSNLESGFEPTIPGSSQTRLFFYARASDHCVRRFSVRLAKGQTSCHQPLKLLEHLAPTFREKPLRTLAAKMWSPGRPR